MAPTPTLSTYRFGSFELDLRSGELKKNGRRVRLQEKPLSLLMALAERPGELVARADLRERLWPGDTFVAFEDGLNTAMRKLRGALDDDSQAPRYIETVRGRGYRFLAAVEPIGAEGGRTEVPELENPKPPETVAASFPPASAPTATPAAAPRFSSNARVAAAFLLGCMVAAIAASLWYWLAHARPVLSSRSHDPMLVSDFENQTGDPHFDRALGTAFNVSLQQSRALTIYSRLQTQTALRLMQRKDAEPITAAVGREICQRENLHALLVPGITRAGNEYRVTAQLVDPFTGVAVRSYAESARDPDHILDALDAISGEIRRDLGESRYEIHQNHRPLPQVTTASMQALEDYSEAVGFFGKGKVNDANRMYHAAITADPGFAMAWGGLAYLDYSFFVNRPDLGEKEFRTALSLEGRTTEREHSWIELRYAESQGRVDDALRLYRLFLQRYPDDWAAEYSYARLLRMHGHAQEAVPIYRQLIPQQPDNANNWIELATAFGELGQWSQSIQAYEKAFSIEPSRLLTDNINHEYGTTLVRAGNDAKAEEVFSDLLGSPNTYPYGQRYLGMLDMYHGKFESARNRMMLSLAASHDAFAVARIRYWLAAIAETQGNRREEMAQLDIAMAEFDVLGPKVEYGAILGQAYARAGEMEKAKQILDRIALIANDRMEDQAAYLALLKAEVAAAQGDPNAALQFLKPPESGDSNATAVFTREALAHVYQNMGNRDQAILWYSQFLKGGLPGWEPQRYWFEAEYTLAEDCQLKGQIADAVHWLNNLLDPWKNADSGLPLLKKARLLRDRVAAQH
jgi:DNA-binding winged helix-turn-helix (wHTH) protein/tetratricopeptide (TPR) repeat protein